MIRMDCGEVRELLHVYEDDELPASERAEVARHLHECADCSEALAALRSLRARIKGAGTFATPAGLEDRVRLAIGIAAERRVAPSRTRFAALAASHVVVAALGALVAAALVSRSDNRTVIARDVVAAHVRSLLGEQIVQVASAETHTVKPWFAGRVPFAPEVVDLIQRDFPLIGGRLDYILERPAVAIVYGRRKHRINLFILPERQAGSSADFEAVRDGYNVVVWQQAGFAYFAASDLNAPELREFTQAIRQVSER